MELGCTTFQIFTRNPRTWASRTLGAAEVSLFRSKLAASSIGPVFSHMPYIPNLSSPNTTVYKKSVTSLLEEVERSTALGVPYIVIHLGSRVGSDPAEAKTRLASAVAVATDLGGPRLLLENGAGSGGHMGSTMEDLAELIGLISSGRVGIAFDTCHAFASGYDVGSEFGLGTTLDVIRRTVGMERVKLIHLNDSVGVLGSGIDRHEHIGMGQIGESGFRSILRSALSDLPLVMETPIDERRSDAENLAKVRALAV